MHCIYDGTHSYYDVGVAMVDCVTVIVYTACLGSFIDLERLLYINTVGDQEKATEIDFNDCICCSMLAYRSLAPL